MRSVGLAARGGLAPAVHAQRGAPGRPGLRGAAAPSPASPAPGAARRNGPRGAPGQPADRRPPTLAPAQPASPRADCGRDARGSALHPGGPHRRVTWPSIAGLGRSGRFPSRASRLPRAPGRGERRWTARTGSLGATQVLRRPSRVLRTIAGNIVRVLWTLPTLALGESATEVGRGNVRGAAFF